MLYRILICLTFLVTTTACTKQQDGSLSGTVEPHGSGVHAVALQNGKSVSSAEASPLDGGFQMTLPPGVYDISVNAPSSPFPLMFTGISVEPGKTTVLPPVEIAQKRSGNAVLSGRIYPLGIKTTVTIIEEGRERASVQTDSLGTYKFSGLPAGNYTLRAEAPEYAQTIEEVAITDDHSATQNLRLLYAEQINGVDWSAGIIRVIGTGFPPANAGNPTSRRELARRAAIADAERNLLNVLSRIKISPDQNLKSYLGSKNFTRRIRGFIQGFKIVGERQSEDGKIELDVELPISGRSGLTHYLRK
jgi:hypothetical protein